MHGVNMGLHFRAGILETAHSLHSPTLVLMAVLLAIHALLQVVMILIGLFAFMVSNFDVSSLSETKDGFKTDCLIFSNTLFCMSVYSHCFIGIHVR